MSCPGGGGVSAVWALWNLAAADGVPSIGRKITTTGAFCWMTVHNPRIAYVRGLLRVGVTE